MKKGDVGGIGLVNGNITGTACTFSSACMHAFIFAFECWQKLHP
jgi:hypothetical protein